MLNEKHDRACKRLAELRFEQSILQSKADEIRLAVKNNEHEIAVVTRERDELHALIGMTSGEKKKNDAETDREHKLAVVSQMRQVAGSWIKPAGIALLTGIDAEEVCAILRNISKISGVPLEHNGDRGRGSMYRWVGEPLASE